MNLESDEKGYGRWEDKGIEVEIYQEYINFKVKKSK
jgi:hypothetical protein